MADVTVTITVSQGASDAQMNDGGSVVVSTDAPPAPDAGLGASIGASGGAPAPQMLGDLGASGTAGDAPAPLPLAAVDGGESVAGSTSDADPPVPMDLDLLPE